MRIDRYRALVAFSTLISVMALVAPGILAKHPHRSQKTLVQEDRLAENPETEIFKAQPLPAPEKIAAIFGWVPATRSSVAASLPEERKADWIRPVGEITSVDGFHYFYFKDERIGRVFRVWHGTVVEGAGALLEETPEFFKISLDGQTYIVPRRR